MSELARLTVKMEVVQLEEFDSGYDLAQVLADKLDFDPDKESRIIMLMCGVNVYGCLVPPSASNKINRALRFLSNLPDNELTRQLVEAMNKEP